MEAKKVTSFVKEVLARINGDTDKAIAEKNYRKADAAVRGQISSLESRKVDAEIAVETAKEELADAKYPTNLIGDNSDYIRNIVRKQERVDEAQAELEDVNESLDYFKALNKEFNP